MITKLTPQQEGQLDEFRDRWLKIGLNCEPLDREKAKAAIGKMYQAIGKPEPVILFFSSPAMCLLAWAALRGVAALGKNLDSQLGSQLDSQLRSQLWSQLGSQLDSQLDSQLRSQLRSQLDSQLDSQLRSQLENYFGGQHWLAWEAFYDFCNKIGVNYDTWQRETLDMWLEQSRECHWWWPYDGIVIASDRHTELYRNARGQLHRDGGMAVKYSDGWGTYRLNGVSVDEKYVMTPAEGIEAKDVLSETNVEVRRELIRKIGVERFIQAAGAKVLNKQGDYELLSVRLSDEIRDARFLKMLNPSIGVWHVEGVAPKIKTVQEALNWRAGITEGNWEPAALT